MSWLSTAAMALLPSCGWFGGATEVAPPGDLQCVINPVNACFIHLDGGSVTVGAQAIDPGAPGYDPDAFPDDGPVQQVQVPPFWLMQEELAHSNWGLCVDSGACTTTSETGPQPGMGEMKPIISNISWSEAQQLCGFVGGRLPTDAEWTYAARGTEGRRYPWGDAPPCGLGSSADVFSNRPVAAWRTIPGCETSKAPTNPRGYSPERIRDLAWGHWEWVADDLGDHKRIQRGGAWTAEDAQGVRSSVRSILPADVRTFDAGVRCAW